MTFVCKACGARFTSIQALGGHTSMHSRTRESRSEAASKAARNRSPIRVLTVNDADWADRAACKGMDQALFFPKQVSWKHDSYQEARRVCAGCEVRDDCLAYVMKLERSGHRNGCWGATSPSERGELARGRRTA
jgi:WhiB family redox-sensing transcriptional regulator